MDLSAIRAKLQKLEQDGQQGNNVDYSENFWRPKELGTYKIRILPSKYQKDDPFTELYFHTRIRKYPILALTSFGQQDPVEDFRKILYSTNSKDNWSLAGKLSPKPRYVMPIVVRGEEDKGVRLWEVSQTVYKALLKLASDEEIGDFTDVANGLDMTVERSQGTQFIEISVRAARKNSPVSDDPKLVEKWLNEQPNPLDCYQRYDYDYIKKQLDTFINGGVAPNAPVASTEAASEGNTAVPETSVKESKPAEMKLQTTEPVKPKAAPKSVVSKFDDLFGDSESSDKGADDLPF